MTTRLHQETAKIYAFPVKTRLAGGRSDSGKPASDLGLQRAPEIVYGGSWYHDAAVQEADRSRKA
ncbi:DUF2735 domain-containing protein [Methylobacterium trifolii]|uniref:DUF2735 domain-containing protein n=1 Tax=Methylobacterium trifolii TaxID=1003092 RepID=A0ABQ4U602_9HYPH|nr:DUF2735 domain-containing protein [Methylobacterium trifolii]GJE62463.1 hypothetical protein MPOCJGCO_4596 [Methylobacterium trifolii]